MNNNIVSLSVIDGKCIFELNDKTTICSDLSNDIFLDDTGNNRHENGNVYLYFTNKDRSINIELVIPEDEFEH